MTDLKKYTHFIYDQLINGGMNDLTAKYINLFALIILLFIALLIVDVIIRKILLGLFEKVAARSKTNFDDLLVANKAPRNIAHIIPLIVAMELVPYVFVDFEYIENLAENGLELFAIILTLWIVRSILHTFKDYFKTLPSLKDKPVDSYIQVFMIFAWVAGVVAAFALITDTPIWKFFTALGAASAVLILVFKDTILGFVASIQVAVNDMVRIGDWITFTKYGADGDVIEINLATVKVRNFDNTITTIPTYALISDSFKNWRGMVESGGRRIKRALTIRQESVRFLSNEEIEDLKKIALITDYLNDKQAEINKYNEDNEVNKEVLINGRNLTNVGVFRKYMDEYLTNHPAMNKDMMIMVRQLSPTTQGIPLEIYAFSNDKRWANYEYIMADVFDHFLAAVPYFKIELFELQHSTGVNN